MCKYNRMVTRIIAVVLPLSLVGAVGCVKNASEPVPPGSEEQADQRAERSAGVVSDEKTVRPTLAPDEHANICAIDQPFPYADGSPYVGLHADRENNNRVYCRGGDRYVRAWPNKHVLGEQMVFQPISFDPMHGRLYVTVARMHGCKLFAIDAQTGEVVWCKGREGTPDALTIGVSGGTPEVDQDGNVYVTDGLATPEQTAVYAWNSDGEKLWRAPLGDISSTVKSDYLAPAGLHFTPEGDIATVTPGGVVVLLSREDGHIVSTFDIPGETGFVPPRTTEEPNMSRLPKGLRKKLQTVLGNVTPEELTVFMNASKGASGAFCDNTVGISPKNQILVVGGGPTPDDGSLVALNIVQNGTDTHLEMAWYLVIEAGSATSPAISKHGDRVVVGDGASHLVYARIDRCNANTDGDSRPEVCQAAWTYPLIGKSLLGSAAIDENGVVYAWNSARKADAVDLFALKDSSSGPEVVWQITFRDPDGFNMQWTSSATVLDNQVVGTVTKIRRSIDVKGNPLMLRLSHELMGVSRTTGSLLWRTPVPDDSINSPAVGPDGSLYIPLLGVLDLTSPSRKTHYTGGVVKYRPIYYRD